MSDGADTCGVCGAGPKRETRKLLVVEEVVAGIGGHELQGCVLIAP